MYIVSEYCDKGDLLAMIKKNGAMSEQQAVEILEMVLKGLAYLEEHGVVHRDLKPANVLMKGTIAKIGDFGFCMFEREQTDPQYAGYSIGSPLYMSPEAYRNRQYSIKSDIWSCGILFYEMLLGSQPFPGLSYDQLAISAA
jgi:serine/threonine-protein kinase ULK/ATG1